MDRNLPKIGDYIYMKRVKYQILNLEDYEVVGGKLFARNITLKATHLGMTCPLLPVESMFTTSEFECFFQSLISAERYEQGIRIIETNSDFLGIDLMKKLNAYAKEKTKMMEWGKAEFARRWVVEICKTGEEVDTESLAHSTWDLGRFYDKFANYYEEKHVREQGRKYRIKAIQAYEESKQAFQQIGSVHDVHQIRWFISVNYRYISEYEQALDILNQIEIYFLEHGNDEENREVLLEKARNYYALRMLEKARQTYSRLSDLAVKAGWEIMVLSYLYQQANLATMQGKLKVAQTLLRDFERLAADNESLIKMDAQLRMFAAKMQGDSTEKEQGTYANESLIIDAKWLRMIIARKRGDSNEIERITSELISYFQKHQDELQLAKVYKEQASSFEDQGRYQEALDLYRMARDIYETNEAFEPLGRLEMEMGILYKNINRFGDALDHHRRAWDIFVANDMANEIELCRKNLITTITKAAYQATHLERDTRLWYYNRLINEGKIDELITKIEEGSDIWKRY